MDFEDARRSGEVTVDKGGRTRFGIAERYNRDMPAGFYDSMDNDQAYGAAKERYKKKYWLPLFDKIDSNNVAAKLFDMRVNPGEGVAVKYCQEAINECGERIEADNKFGPNTLAALNRCESMHLLNGMRERCVDHYLRKIQEDPSQEKNRRGWLRRARS